MDNQITPAKIGKYLNPIVQYYQDDRADGRGGRGRAHGHMRTRTRIISYLPPPLIPPEASTQWPPSPLDDDGYDHVHIGSDDDCDHGIHGPAMCRTQNGDPRARYPDPNRTQEPKPQAMPIQPAFYSMPWNQTVHPPQNPIGFWEVKPKNKKETVESRGVSELEVEEGTKLGTAFTSAFYGDVADCRQEENDNGDYNSEGYNIHI